MKKTQTTKVMEVLQANLNKWLPAYYFVGVRKGIEGNVFLSYKAPTRLSEIFAIWGVAEVMQRKTVAAYGSRYFCYMLTKNII